MSFVTEFIWKLYSCCQHFFTEPSHVSDPSPPDPTNSHVKEGQIVAENANELSNHQEIQILGENEDMVEHHLLSNGNDDFQETELASSAQADAPKKSYASIVSINIVLSLASTVLVQILKFIEFVVGESPKGEFGIS